MKKLDHSAQVQVLKGIRKVSHNPLPKEEGGYDCKNIKAKGGGMEIIMDKVQKVILTNMCQISNGDEILVQNKISKNYSGITFPGGHIEENEIITDAIIREVFEETGLQIKNPIMCGLYDWINENGTRYFVFLYKADDFSGELHSSEEGEVKWIKKDRFLHEKLAQGMETVFKIINCESLSECFYNKEAQEEIIK